MKKFLIKCLIVVLLAAQFFFVVPPKPAEAFSISDLFNIPKKVRNAFFDLVPVDKFVSNFQKMIEVRADKIINFTQNTFTGAKNYVENINILEESMKVYTDMSKKVEQVLTKEFVTSLVGDAMRGAIRLLQSVPLNLDETFNIPNPLNLPNFSGQGRVIKDGNDIGACFVFTQGEAQAFFGVSNQNYLCDGKTNNLRIQAMSLLPLSTLHQMDTIIYRQLCRLAYRHHNFRVSAISQCQITNMSR